MNDFQCVSIQVYSKVKTPFYKYKPGSDRHGIAVTADALYRKKANGFQASISLPIFSIAITYIVFFIL